MITKELFTIDGFNNFYEGYSNKNETWNGWDTPCFEKNIVEKLIKLDNNNEHLRFVYDENNDVYIEYDIDNDLTREYEGYDI